MNPPEPNFHPTGPAAADGGIPPVLPGLEFSGCTPIRLKPSEIETYEGRLEFWDADAATAWVAEPTTPVHERPSRALSALAERIAQVHGSPVTCLGKMKLYEAWSFPEVWIQVPSAPSPSRPKSRLPGLTIFFTGGRRLSGFRGEPGVSGLDGG